jgi:hypothetical protein
MRIAVLGVVLAGLWVGCGTSGQPASPVASIAGQSVSSGAFEHWTRSFDAGKGAGAQSDPKLEAMTFLINAGWIRHEAEALRLSVSRAELDDRLRQEAEEFGGQAGLRELRRRVGLTPADYRTRLRLDILGRKLQDTLVEIDPVTADQIEIYYRDHPERFVRPPARELRVAVAKEKREAQVVAAALRRGEGWASVEERHDGVQSAPADQLLKIDASNIFPGLWEAVSSVPQGEIGGPVPVRDAYWIFEVVTGSPAGKVGIEDARAQIRAILETTRENHQFRQFVELLRRKYRQRTTCLAAYKVPECGAIVGSSDELHSAP